MRLNLGCSDSILPGYVNVDVAEPYDVHHNLEWLPWPWAESSVDEVRAHDIVEHVWPIATSVYAPGALGLRCDCPKIAVMNEIYRVLKPGGKLDLFVPTTDGRGAWQDPTHKVGWTPNDIFYFSDRFAEWQRFRTAYGITANFTVLEQSHMLYGPREDNVWKWRAVMEAVK